MAALIRLALALVLTALSAYAFDPSMLQDFCVATNDHKLFLNGLSCKNPNEVTADDFVFRSPNISLFNDDGLGISGTLVNPLNLPGLNTMGISVSQAKYAPKGTSAPHNHPRASEIVVVIEGTLYVGFVSGTNKLYSNILNAGDVAIFPQGLVHFLYNPSDTYAQTVSGFNSQNPRVGPIANKIFGTDPPISVDVISKGFQLDPKIIEDLQSKF